MTQPLQLFDTPAVPQLTDRQAYALTVIQQAGVDGLHTDELGAKVHGWQGKHSADELCDFCGSSGMELGRSLRGKKLVQQRRRRAPGGDAYSVWTVAGKLPRAVEAVAPFEWPDGF